jgi:VanZ family protein
MSRRLAWGVLGMLVILLFLGTLIPGAWRNAAEVSLGTPAYFSSLAHFVLFFLIALVTRHSPLAFSVLWVALFALGLGLMTEGLQFFAMDRHPRWRDVGIDCAGALLGLAMAWTISMAWGLLSRRDRH